MHLIHDPLLMFPILVKEIVKSDYFTHDLEQEKRKQIHELKSMINTIVAPTIITSGKITSGGKIIIHYPFVESDNVNIVSLPEK